MSVPAAGAAPADEVDLRRAVRTAWDSLPALATTGAALSAATVLGLALLPTAPAASLLAAGVVGALSAALVSVAGSVVEGRSVDVASLPRHLRRAALPALVLGCPPAAAAVCALAAVAVWDRTASAPALLSAATSAAAVVVLTLAGLVALPLRLAGHPARGTALLVTSLHVVARRPVAVLAVVATGVLLVLAAQRTSATALYLAPVPLAFALVSAVRASAARCGVLPPVRYDHPDPAPDSHPDPDPDPATSTRRPHDHR